MNRKLKAKIIENFGTQSDFSEAIQIDESIISKIVRNRRELPTEQKKVWAEKLNCMIEEIFPK
jgi:plasmid maintenance system antidote protein VapI